MNPTHIHEGMLTFLGAQLARYEERTNDAELLEETYEGTPQEMAAGTGTLAAWLLMALAIERDEEIESTIRLVLEHVAAAHVHSHEHEDCSDLSEDDDGSG